MPTYVTSGDCLSYHQALHTCIIAGIVRAALVQCSFSFLHFISQVTRELSCAVATRASPSQTTTKPLARMKRFASRFLCVHFLESMESDTPSSLPDLQGLYAHL